MHSIGVAPVPIPRRKLSVDRLAAGISQATTYPAMRRRADHLARRVQAEDGANAAVDALERLLSP